MLMNKAGKMPSITGFVTGIVGVIVTILLASELIPEAQTAGDTLNSSGVPLGNLFASDGVIFTVIMAGIFIAIAGVAFAYTKRK